MANKRNEYGEGNYEATRQYNRATKRFVESGRVARAARDAAPRSPEEAAKGTLIPVIADNRERSLHAKTFLDNGVRNPDGLPF